MTAETAHSENLTDPEPVPEPTLVDDPELAEDDELEEEPAYAPVEPFDIEKEALSFSALESGRASVYHSHDAKARFRAKLEALPKSGDAGRRRGLGWWMLAEYARCAEELAAHEADDTAAYTRARSLLSIGAPAGAAGAARMEEAARLFQRLSEKYPQQPRPRAGLLESRIELAHLKGGEDAERTAQEVKRAVEGAPTGFADSVEGLYLLGRAAELARDPDGALGFYERAHAADPVHQGLLTRYAHLAERCGLDDLALELYESLLGLRPVDRSVLMNLGVLYEDVGRDADAASCYDTVLRDDATDLRARLYLADARAAMNMYYDEDLEKKEDRLNQILRIPITDFELSVRARNCLNKMQITTLGDLVQKTEQELLSYKNFGETSLTEIKEILHSKGLRLGMPRDEAVASIEAHARRMQSGDRSDVMNKPILELALSIRARRTVETLGCLTVGDITKHSAEELLGMPNFGQTSLQELRTKLTELGLKLKGE